MIYQSSIGSISLGDWLTDYHFVTRNTSMNYLVHGCAWEYRTWCCEKSLVSIVFCVALVVKLDIIEVYCVAHCTMDGYICAIFVKLFFEVWSLGSMSDHMVWQLFAEFSLKLYNPIFTLTCFHSTVVLPVDVNTIKVVGSNKRSQLLGASHRINSTSRWKLSRTKGTDQNFDSIIIIFLLEVFLNLILSLAKHRIRPKILNRISPDIYNIKWTTRAPESKSNIVINSWGGVPRYTQSSRDFLWRPPLIQLIDVDHPHRVIYRHSLKHFFLIHLLTLTFYIIRIRNENCRGLTFGNLVQKREENGEKQGWQKPKYVSHAHN